MMRTLTKLFGAGTMLVLAAGLVSAQSHPSHQITNGELTAAVYLPDVKNGFYKTTRFDWSGAIGSLTLDFQEQRVDGSGERVDPRAHQSAAEDPARRPHRQHPGRPPRRPGPPGVGDAAPPSVPHPRRRLRVGDALR